jgi:hypothetical protein
MANGTCRSSLEIDKMLTYFLTVVVSDTLDQQLALLQLEPVTIQMIGTPRYDILPIRDRWYMLTLPSAIDRQKIWAKVFSV